MIQEKQLKKVRAKQKRLQAILGGEDTLRVEAELLAEDDDDEEGEALTFDFFKNNAKHLYLMQLWWLRKLFCGVPQFRNCQRTL